MKKMLLIAATLLISQVSAAETQPTQKWTFLVVHKQENIENIKLNQEFADRVKERTGGSFEINFKSMSSEKNTGEVEEFLSAIARVYTAQAEMSQISVKHFVDYSQDLDVLDMPMVFRNHEHARLVLDGKIGKELLESVYVGSNYKLRGMAFTYSGGFRDIFSSKPITTLEELKGMNIVMHSRRTTREVVNFLGLVPVVGKRLPRNMMNGEIQVEEAEVNRIAHYASLDPEFLKTVKSALETHHSLYLTMITVNEAAYKKLSKDQLKVFKEEVDLLAKKERALSIQQGIDNKKIFQEKGIKFVSLDANDSKILTKMGNQIHAKYQKQHGRWFKAINAVWASMPKNMKLLSFQD